MYRTLDRGVLVAAGLVITLLLLNAAIAYRNTRQLRDDAGLVAHSHAVLDLADGVLLAVVDAETGERGYLLTEQPAYLQPYVAALPRLASRLAALRDATKDNPEQRQRVEKLEGLAADRLVLLRRRIDLRRVHAPDAAALDAARQGKDQMDAVRALVAEIRQAEQDLLVDRERQSDATYRVAVGSGWIAAGLGLAAAGGFVWLVDRSMRARLAAAAAVREQREWLRTTLASVGDAVVATDTAGRVAFLNPVAEGLTGWPRQEAEGQPLDAIFRIVNEDTRQPAANPVHRALREGTVVGLANHTVLIARGGRERPIDDSAAPIKDEAGNLLGVVLIFRDVTDRRGTENALRRNEERLRLFVEHVPAAVAMLDRDLRYLLASRRWSVDFGLGDRDLRGERHDHVFPDLPAHWRDVFRRCLDGKVESSEEDALTRPDGRTEWLRWEARPWYDDRGAVGGVLLFCEVITARRQAETAMREQANTLTGILAATVDHVYVVDRAGHYRYVSAGGAAVVGLEPAAMAGKGWRELGLSAEIMVPFDRLREAVLGSGAPARQETQFRSPDGSERAFEYVIAPIAAAARGADAVVVISRDVTERRRAEEALAHEGRNTETLYRIGVTLAAELDLQNIVQTVTDEATALTGARFGAFFYNVLNEQGEAYTLYTLSGVPRSEFERFPMPRNTALFEPTFRGRGAVRLDDVTRDPRYGQSEPHHGMPAGHLRVRSYLAVSVVSRSGEVLGGLFFGHPDAGVFLERHERLVIGIAAQAAVAIDNARLYRRIQESEARLAAIINNSPAIIFLKDLAGRYVLVNRRYEDSARSWGVEGPYVGRTDADLLPPDIAARFHRDDLDVIATREVKVYEESWDLNGDPRTGITTKFPLVDEAGRVYAVCGINLDITDRKRAEEAVRASEERLRLALEAGRMGVWDWNILSDELRWSESLEALHGLPAGTFGGTEEAFRQLVHPDDRAAVTRALRRSLDEQTPYEVEFRTLRPDGAVRWLTEKGKIFAENGRPTRMIGVGMDISERKRVEVDNRFLADASAALAGLVDYESTLQAVARLAVPGFADWVAVDMLDEGGTLRRLAVAHVDPSKVLLAHEVYRRYPPDPDATHGVWNIIRTGKSEITPLITDEILVATVRDAALLDILRQLGLRSYLAVPLTARGRVLGVMTFIAAESGRRYDAADAAVAEDLAHRAAVAIENARLYQAVREADRRKDEFLALLGHELRNPLAPIRNALHIIHLSAGDPPTLQRARQMMERQVEHLVRLVDDLLDVSRIMRGKIELRREPVELAAVVARAVEMSQPFVDAESHELTVSVPAEPIRVDGDLLRLAQVVSNLLINAAKYTERGGRIDLAVSAAGGEAVLQVRDTGIGIDPAALPRLFDMFYQGERRTKESQGGLGLGLSLVRGLVELHGGTVEAHSAGPGTGSEFVVRLPLLSGDPEERGVPAEPAARPARASRRVLVVDDNVDAADSLALLLRLEGQEVQVAYDGARALAQAEANPPDLAFVDLGMPKMDGYAVARAFRAHPVLRNAVLVALTGWGQPEDRQRTRDAGFDHHLVKPVDAATLHELLANPSRHDS